jgi:hypothetical protein
LLFEILRLSTFASSFISATFITFFTLTGFGEIFFDTLFVFLATTFLTFFGLTLATFLL